MSALSDASAELQDIAEFYGYDAQSRQLIEEMAELTQALNKFWRKDMNCGKSIPILNTTSEQWVHIAEEIADVKICLEQVEYLLQCGWLVDRYVDEKIDRQLQSIKDGDTE